MPPSRRSYRVSVGGQVAHMDVNCASEENQSRVLAAMKGERVSRFRNDDVPADADRVLPVLVVR